MFSLKSCLYASGFAWALVALAAPEPVPPVEAFFRTADISRPRLSADGNRVVFLVRNDPKRQSIATLDVRTKQGAIVFVPNDYNVDFAFWKGDRIVFGGDVGGNESYALRSIKADGSDLRDLNESYQKYRRVQGPIGGNVFSRLPNDRDHILVAGYGVRRNSRGDLEASGEPGFYRLNVLSGRRDWTASWDERALGYFVDDQSGVVFGRTTQAGNEQVFEIKNTAGEFRPIGKFTGLDAPWQFIGLLPGAKKAILEVRSAQEHDRGALYAFDLETLKRGERLYEPPEGEIERVHRTPDGRIVGITRETDKLVTDWFDPTWARVAASLKATFPGKAVILADSTPDARCHIAYVYSDRDPGAFYFFDAAKPEIIPLGRINPTINPEQMAERRPIHYSARDGLEIHGYLTRPRGAEQKKHPLVILPHGGPFGIRDSWDFDPEAEFLASRGYAVLQVNYRGSGGYGARFQEAGKKQWGRKMQDDLTDAVHWAVAEGIADADQVGIYGASYGGYAVLAGLVYTPELYRCGANYVGVSDLAVFTKPTEDKGRFFDMFVREWIASDAADSYARSPVNFVQNIRVPSLHAYGENDPRVDIAHWQLLERQLKKYNKPYVVIREGDEGHGFETENSRIRFYRALEKFLGENLPTTGRVTLGELKTTELPAREAR